jgi:membrane protein required for colicin V production
MAMAVFKGYSRGLIVAIFSFFAIIIGLAAALKLSTVVADWLGHSTNLASKWLPFLSFVMVMVGFILLIRLVAGIIQKGVEFMLMGWINRLGGIILYAAIYTTVFSVVLFFAEKIHVLKPHAIQESVLYSYIEPFGPKIVNGFALIVPFFKNMFSELETFFGSVSKSMS